jgi:hypothetical protein
MKCSPADSCVKILRFSDISVTDSAPFFTLKMGTKTVPEMLENIHTLTRLSAEEHLIEFCHCKSFKISNITVGRRQRTALVFCSKEHFLILR